MGQIISVEPLQTDKTINIGGYGPYFFREYLGINYLESVLLCTFRIVPYFFKNDKTPNFDGWFEVCGERKDEKSKVIPLCRFSVQIKTLNSDYKNDNKVINTEFPYKYSCDTKIINAVLERITLDPTILFLVDWDKRIIYWKYLTEDFCLKEKADKKGTFTCYFSDKDKLMPNETWISGLLDIHKKHTKKLYDREAASIMLLSESKEILPVAQKVWDHLNFIMEGEFNFIRRVYFPNAWKLGIAYTEKECYVGKEPFTENVIKKIVGFYQIKVSENDIVIKQYDPDIDGLHFSILATDIGIESAEKIYLKNLIESYFGAVMVKYHIPLLPELALQEIVFEELDLAFLRLQTYQRKKEIKVGDIVCYGIQQKQLTYEEYKTLSSEGKASILADACVAEMQKRGIVLLQRVWEKCLCGAVGKEIEATLTDHATGNKPDAMRFEMAADIEAGVVKDNNFKKMQENKEEFVETTIERLNEQERKIIDKTAFVSSIQQMRVDLVGDFSWYKLWRIGMEYFALRYVDDEDNPLSITTRYIAYK